MSDALDKLLILHARRGLVRIIFKYPECVRLSYAASEENLIEAIERIKNQLAKLQ